ncbi:hypothetical protein N0V83_005764 [Neocucurbitaria cava]|uniref:Uncharacterized protein n=1 Tax=Neocucurbitaria cava TaxID=798079 RepID=A0A9W9CMC6_9PLEO|nr:hypothetical protein N0V83_005764 [Neocucurbitaria cava]
MAGPPRRKKSADKPGDEDKGTPESRSNEEVSVGFDGNKSPITVSSDVPEREVDHQYFMERIPGLFLQSRALLPQDRVCDINNPFNKGEPSTKEMTGMRERSELLKQMAYAMERINKATQGMLLLHSMTLDLTLTYEGPPYEKAVAALWTALLEWAYDTILSRANAIHELFQTHPFTLWCPSKAVEREKLIRQHLQKEALVCLLNEEELANTLYAHIQGLAQVKNLHDRFVIMARDAKIVSNFGSSVPTSSPKQHCHEPVRTSKTHPRDIQDSPVSKKRQAFQAAAKPQLELANAATNFFNTVKGYLEDQDCELEYQILQPDAKRVTYPFAAILNERYPNPKWESYHAFGFGTCWTEAQRQLLLGLYHSLLADAGDKVVIFKKLWFALANNDILPLLEENGYTNLEELPGLARFLSRPSNQRETVWRLVQFLHDEKNDEPHPYVKRDFGFQVCRMREDVLTIKEVYAKLLEKCRPSELHQAAMEGALYELGDKKGVFIAPEYRRFMINDHPAPYLGYDNGLGLRRHEAALFRKQRA